MHADTTSAKEVTQMHLTVGSKVFAATLSDSVGRTKTRRCISDCEAARGGMSASTPPRRGAYREEARRLARSASEQWWRIRHHLDTSRRCGARLRPRLHRSRFSGVDFEPKAPATRALPGARSHTASVDASLTDCAGAPAANSCGAAADFRTSIERHGRRLESRHQFNSCRVAASSKEP